VLSDFVPAGVLLRDFDRDSVEVEVFDGDFVYVIVRVAVRE
jgi:hypothetical protein